MEVKDLMVGDWVLRKNKPMRILDIKENGSVRLGFEDGWIGESVTLIEPIPLTPEILEKNGFIRDGYLRLNLSDNLYLEYYVYQNRLRKIFHGIDEWDNHAEVKEIVFECQCHYVHELQHALKLCGVEKEIVL